VFVSSSVVKYNNSTVTRMWHRSS